MELVPVVASLLALLVAGFSLLRSVEAKREARHPSHIGHMEKLLAEYRGFIQESAEKSAAAHARSMKRLKEAEKHMGWQLQDGAAEAPPHQDPVPDLQLLPEGSHKDAIRARARALGRI